MGRTLRTTQTWHQQVNHCGRVIRLLQHIDVASPQNLDICLTALSTTWPPHRSQEMVLKSAPESPPSSTSTSPTCSGLDSCSSLCRVMLPVRSDATSVALPLTSARTLATNSSIQEDTARIVTSIQVRKENALHGVENTVQIRRAMHCIKKKSNVFTVI